MAESLMTPSPKVDESAEEAGYGAVFEGFTGDNPDAAVESGQAGSNTPIGDRAHPQKQFVKQPSVDEQKHDRAAEYQVEDAHQASPAPGMESQRVVVGNALADARRVAEHSGMLGRGRPGSPDVSAEPAAGDQPAKQDSPFEIYDDENDDENDAEMESPASGKTPTLDESKVSEIHPEVEPERDAELSDLTENKPAVSEQVDMAETSSEAMAEGESHALDGEVQSRGPFLTRLKQFSETIRRERGAQAMFLIDDEGQILIDEVEDSRLVQVARTLANASNRANRQTSGAAAIGNLNVKITTHSMLEVIPVESRYGLLILGVIFPAPIGSERVRQVAKELYDTVEPDS